LVTASEREKILLEKMTAERREGEKKKWNGRGKKKRQQRRKELEHV